MTKGRSAAAWLVAASLPTALLAQAAAPQAATPTEQAPSAEPAQTQQARGPVTMICSAPAPAGPAPNAVAGEKEGKAPKKEVPVAKEVGAAVGGTVGQTAGAVVAGPVGAAAGGVIVGKVGEAIGSVFKKKDKKQEPEQGAKAAQHSDASAATSAECQPIQAQ